mgnify:CR=1 FL=1
MAMVCVNGCRECDGCGSCQESSEKTMRCPICGEVVEYDEPVYINTETEKYIGCSNCVGTRDMCDVVDLL